jgi:four helix bundle protein
LIERESKREDRESNIGDYEGEAKMRVERFEDLEVWNAARVLVNRIYRITRGSAFNRDRRLADQMRGAAVSIMSNTAEGFERGSDAEFAQFLYIAKGSAGEVRSQLYVALDEGFVSQQDFDSATNLARSVSQQLGGFIKYLKGSAPRRSRSIATRRRP